MAVCLLSWNVVMTVLSRRDSMYHMTNGTAEYGERPMAQAPASPRSRAGRSDETREALLAAAHDLLATEGASALTVRRIAAAAGVSTMNVYSRFGGKDGVLDELFIHGFQRMSDEMADSPTSDDPIEDLMECGRAYRAFARNNPTYYSLMFDRVAPDFAPSDRAIETALAGHARVIARVERAMEAGAIRQGDPFQVASALWACDHGLASLEYRTPAGARSELFDWDAISETAMRAMLRGLAPDS
jgi:AcrR family transcriptional regulator